MLFLPEYDLLLLCFIIVNQMFVVVRVPSLIIICNTLSLKGDYSTGILCPSAEMAHALHSFSEGFGPKGHWTKQVDAVASCQLRKFLERKKDLEICSGHSASPSL